MFTTPSTTTGRRSTDLRGRAAKPADRVRVTSSAHSDHLDIVVAGSLDLHTLAVLTSALRPASHGGTVRVDLSACDFVSASAIEVLVDIAATSTVTVVAPAGPAAILLNLAVDFGLRIEKKSPSLALVG